MLAREGRIILLVTGLTHFAVHSSMVIFPAIMNALKSEFGVDFDTLGWIYGLSGFMFGLGAIPTGLLESRLGARRLLIICQVGLGLSSFAVFFSESLTQVALALFFLGLSASIYHPAGLTLISKRIPQLSRAMGYHGVAGNLGLALGPILAALLATGATWRLAYGAVAIVSLALAVATVSLLPSEKGAPRAVDELYTEATKTHPLFVYYVIVALVGLTFYGFTTYMPAHFSENTGGFLESLDSTVKGGLFSTVVLAAGIFGQLLGGKLGDRFDRTIILPVIALAHVPMLIAFGSNSGQMLLASGIVLGIVHFSFQPIGNSLIAEFTTSASRGPAYGVSFFLSFGVGAFGSGFGGSLAAKYGVALVYPVVAAWMTLAFVLSLFLKRMR